MENDKFSEKTGNKDDYRVTGINQEGKKKNN